MYGFFFQSPTKQITRLLRQKLAFSAEAPRTINGQPARRDQTLISSSVGTGTPGIKSCYKATDTPS
jgi:hypothetical protein